MLAALFALVVTMCACQMSIDVNTVVRDDGHGSFSLAFQFDKEFVQVVQSAPDGKKSLAQLRSAGSAFTGGGWRVRSSAPDGGLRVEIDRTFSDPDELVTALKKAAAESAGASLSFANVFRDLSISQQRSVFRSATLVSGSVDLTPARLAPRLAANKDVQTLLQQAGPNVFQFRIAVTIPGKIKHYAGDPTRVDGGHIEWLAPFGRVTAFSASASHARGSAFLGIGIAGGALILLGAVLLLRRRMRRSAPVHGWETAPISDPHGSDAAGAFVGDE